MLIDEYLFYLQEKKGGNSKIGSGAKAMGKAVATGLAISGTLAAAGGLMKRNSAFKICGAKHEKGTLEYKSCMHKLVYGHG